MLTIADISVSKGLDHNAMTSVIGGSSHKRDYDTYRRFDISSVVDQNLLQQQQADVVVGNGSAFLGGPISLDVFSAPSQKGANIVK